MPFLSAFCPVKLFGYVVKSQRVNNVAAGVGSFVAAASFPASGILFRKGLKEWARPTLIIGIVGTAVALLGLENEIISARKRSKTNSERLTEASVSSLGVSKEIEEAINYLSTYYWMFWEQRIHQESEKTKEQVERPNIPYELAYAFGYSILLVLDKKIHSRYDKICDLEGDLHPEKWEFRRELYKLDLQERELWVKAKEIVEDYRSSTTAFSKRAEDFSKTKPLLYCRFLSMLRDFHKKYKEILIESRDEKLKRMKQYMAERSVNLPIIPETFTEQSASASKNQGSESSDAATENDVAVESFQNTGASPPWTSDEPVVVSRYENLFNPEEPCLSPRRNVPCANSQNDGPANLEACREMAESGEINVETDKVNDSNPN